MAKLTYQDLTNMARSGDPNERKRGLMLFEAWVKAAPKLQRSEQLTQMEREVLTQIFEQKGLLTAHRQRQVAAKKRMR
jgi:hypothetical protein